MLEIDGMKGDKDLDSRQLQVRLQAIAADIRSLADSHRGNSLALLALLRALELAHREIRENLFQASLPDNRQALYALLKDIEESGGWPYVERLKLRSLLSNLPDPEIFTTDASSD
jgi:hypothetical protein